MTDGGVGLPSDSQLKMVAQLMTEPRRDWRRLLNILGLKRRNYSSFHDFLREGEVFFRSIRLILRSFLRHYYIIVIILVTVSYK